MSAKRRKCCECGADLTKKNYAQVWDEESRSVVVVCPGRCYTNRMKKGWAHREQK